jgi:uncharacterized protein (TIGR02118 family)
MIKVSAFYPNGPDAKFDMEYYCARHIPLVQRLCGAALRGAAVEGGVGDRHQALCLPFLAMGHLLFESVQAFEGSFGPHAKQIVGDVPNYTNVQPVIQVSQVIM